MGFICICLHRVRALVVEARDHEVMRRAPPDARSRRAKGGARHERQRLRKRVNPNAAGLQGWEPRLLIFDRRPSAGPDDAGERARQRPSASTSRQTRRTP